MIMTPVYRDGRMFAAFETKFDADLYLKALAVYYATFDRLCEWEDGKLIAYAGREKGVFKYTYEVGG